MYPEFYDIIWVVGGAVIGYCIKAFFPRSHPQRAPLSTANTISPTVVAVSVPQRIPNPYSLPIIGDAQTVCCVMTKDDKEVASRAVTGLDLAPILTRPKGGIPKEHYTYSHIDERGRLIYKAAA